MFVKPVEIPVCKACPRCGMPIVHSYPADADGKEKWVVTCKGRCVYVTNHNGCTPGAAIMAWNVLIAGPEEPPKQKITPYQTVQYERKVQPIKKFGVASTFPFHVIRDLDAHTRQEVINEETRRAYHRIADKLFEEGIGNVEFVVANHYRKELPLYVSLQVVDDR